MNIRFKSWMALAVRAERGAALLDRVSPGWHEKMHPSALDMGNRCRCALAHVYGNFFDGLEAVGLKHSQASYYGFSLTYRQSRKGENWDILDEQWKKEIGIRCRRESALAA